MRSLRSSAHPCLWSGPTCPSTSRSVSEKSCLPPFTAPRVRTAMSPYPLSPSLQGSLLTSAPTQEARRSPSVCLTTGRSFQATPLTPRPSLVSLPSHDGQFLSSRGSGDLDWLGVLSISSLAPPRCCCHGYKKAQRSEGRHPISGELLGQAVNGGRS